uniref:DUF11 domain-containing protein n=1 Tax=Candidatus Methanogaster sp. ANME-2c ERB4 TaxID=2759911 RepID=A0A7G9YAE4_9EURY|nr:hypothetical protein DFKJNOJC_00002 [Methanosarcinales archaeon ANME-2c ERB4]QNO44978.1 hypothetical protein IKFMCCCA_00003 [Methanosarcinales archaeon ANME-2c ERB4]QNO45021.1 hypothetical protein DLDHEMGK_00005 [Methanosarcinales archaeon ANME-2c ERB4]
MQTKTTIITITAAALLLAALVPVAVGSEYIPESYTLSTNYYDVTGEPYLIATLVGDRELDRGEDAVLEITIQNYGAIYGIKGDEYLDPSDEDYDDEVLLATAELDVEIEKSCADHVDVVLFADSSPVDVIIDVQEIESIEAGKIGTARFPIHIDDDAPAGTYPLHIETCYDHIRNVQVSGTPDKPDINYWNTTGAQNQTIVIIVEKESDFEVTGVASDLQVGGAGFLNVTYQNTGEETATDAIARVSDMLPFTAVTNQERLGTIVPGESVTAHFRVNTDRSAVPKVYDLSTGIRFKDEDGDIQISDPMQIGVTVAPKVPFSKKLLANKWLIVAAAIALLAFGGWRALKR